MTPSLPRRPRPPSRARDLLLLGGLIGLVLFGLAGLALATGWSETMAQLSRLGPAQVALLLGLSLINYLLRGLRWHVFVRRAGLGGGPVRNLVHFLGGLAMSVTPGRVGELVRMRWLARETGAGFERTAPLMLVDRASDLAAMALILAAGLAFSSTSIAGALPVTLLALIVALVATRAPLLTALADLGYRLTGRLPRLFARLRAAARSLARFSGAGVLTGATAIGLLGWMAEAYAFFLLLGWLGAGTGLAAATAIFVFSTLAGGLTGAPGGVGGAEAAMVALLTLQGVPLEVSIPATAIIRLTTLWFAILIGLCVFPFAERRHLGVR